MGWELHEAEEWWDQKIMNKQAKNNDERDELLSDDNIGIHGFTATHIANAVQDDNDRKWRDSTKIILNPFMCLFFSTLFFFNIILILCFSFFYFSIFFIFSRTFNLASI